MENNVLPGHTDEGHPDLFNTLPVQKTQLKAGQLTEQQLKQFVTDGFLVLDSFFTRDELDPAREAVDMLVDGLAQTLHKAGKIKSLYSECDFYSRLIKIEHDFPGANILMHKLGKLPKELSDIWSNERALNLAEQILGTADIAGNPIWNLRTKTPNNEASTVPWHQDVAYTDNKAYKVYQLTAWIPLLDTNETNGCLQMIRGGHKTGRVADHECCQGNTWYVMLVEDEIKNKLECDVSRDVVTCPVPYGGMVIFNNMVPHRSLDNLSDVIRWSLDFRWQSADVMDGCFYGLKDCVRMRSSTDPDFRIDWDSFNNVNRNVKQQEVTGKPFVDEFDTTIHGPWMLKWPMSHKNRHTDSIGSSAELTWHTATITG
jgi:hypothetical protein